MLGACLLVVAVVYPERLAAQRPFRMYDPFYRSEQTRRVFYGDYALSAEISYRPAGALQSDGLQAVEANPLGLSFRLDYQLAQRLDLSAIIDAAGHSSSSSLSLSWILLKYYERSENATYALRVAVDPSFDGRTGFPQMDLAWLSTTYISPLSSSEFAFGLRRVRIGYERWMLPEELPLNDPSIGQRSALFASLADRDANLEVIYTRALGWEAHLMLGYNVHFDPAGSNLFVAVLGQAGNYDLIETPVRNDPPPPEKSIQADDGVISTDFLGAVVWLRAGIEFNRPSYQILPFVGFPFRQWLPDEGTWPASRKQLGVRLMLR